MHGISCPLVLISFSLGCIVLGPRGSGPGILTNTFGRLLPEGFIPMGFFQEDP